ncbi:MAG: hypothetical protein VB082_10775 [Christensenella sp.]|nr:hypothetical protein [Christensenella sp.]
MKKAGQRSNCALKLKIRKQIKKEFGTKSAVSTKIFEGQDEQEDICGTEPWKTSQDVMAFYIILFAVGAIVLGVLLSGWLGGISRQAWADRLLKQEEATLVSVLAMMEEEDVYYLRKETETSAQLKEKFGRLTRQYGIYEVSREQDYDVFRVRKNFFGVVGFWWRPQALARTDKTKEVLESEGFTVVAIDSADGMIPYEQARLREGNGGERWYLII